METQDPNQPQQPPEEQPTQPEQPTAPQPAAPAPRRLYRSRSDRMIGGVAGGIARYFGVDPVMVRIVAVVLVLFGGASALAYLAALVLVPLEPVEGGEAAPPAEPRKTKPWTIAAVVVGLLIAWPVLLGGGLLAIPLAFLALAGLFTWWLVSGEGPGEGAGDVARRAALGLGVLLLCFAIFIGGAWAAGVGGGTVAAVLVIVAGATLVVSAFAGGWRLLILPALALAIGVGFVSATDIDLKGGVGQREYSPTSANDIRDRYQVGIGQLVVDLRQTELPKGDTPLKLKVGVGEALVLVPRDVCVASRADIGAGAVNVFERDNGGLDLSWEDQPAGPAGARRVVVDADVGVGAFEVQHERRDRFLEHHSDDTRSNSGCAAGAGSAA